jgi:2-polyprenyl-3-methyl-5-hydroxy-6-metoxy-1,4-benzoquinol methylase
VVSTELPELIPYADYCYLANNKEAFCSKIVEALNEEKRLFIIQSDRACERKLMGSASSRNLYSFNKRKLMNLSFLKYVKDGFKIADIGCGPNGAYWWDEMNNCTIDAFDLYNKPKSFERGSNRITFSQTDVCNPKNLSAYHKKFDIAVCDHIFEHVTDPYGLALGCNNILKQDALLHIGIPDGDNFTDRFLPTYPQ